MEAFIAAVIRNLTPEWVVTAAFTLALLIIVRMRSGRSRSSQPSGDGKASCCGAGARITIINNVRGRRVRVRRHRSVKRRKLRPATEESDGCKNGDEGMED